MKTSMSLPQPDLSRTVGSRATPVLEQSIGDTLRVAAERWPDRTALIEGEAEVSRRARWSYAELLAGAERRAWTFLSAFAEGDAVAIWAPNCAEWVFLELGAALAGITLVTVNPAYLASELAHVLKQSCAKGLIMVATSSRTRSHRGGRGSAQRPA